MLRSFLLLTTPCFLTVFTQVVVWASTLPFPPPLASAQRIFTLFSIVQAWVPFCYSNCHHPLYSNICLYICTSVRLYFCTSVLLYICTSVRLDFCTISMILYCSCPLAPLSLPASFIWTVNWVSPLFI